MLARRPLGDLRRRVPRQLVAQRDGALLGERAVDMAAGEAKAASTMAFLGSA